MESPGVYMPVDRRQALALGLELPPEGQGAILFADISGFTPLTEALARAFGTHRGAEELTVQINRVYDALIAQVNRFGGSVIGFAGDAITCWFDDAPVGMAGVAAGGPRAASCALALQAAMQQFASVPLPDGSSTALQLKVLVTSGRCRRFVVGDPDVQLIDVLTGSPALRIGAGDHLAERGEALIDAETAALLGAGAALGVWRTDEESGERFAVLLALNPPAPPAPWPELGARSELVDEAARAWTLPAIYARMRAGLGDFLTELRPTVALFLRLSGLDLVADPNGPAAFDAFIRWAQGIIARYDASLLQVTVGDKGAYLYASFGAPLAHEDDPRRAAMAALELRSPPADLGFAASVQIGLSRGTTRTGAYGGAGVRTYGSLGDEVNLAARLMQRAGPGEVLASERVQEPTSTAFLWDVLPPVQVKGKRDPIPVARLIEARQARSLGEFSGELVGREAELGWLGERSAAIFRGAFGGVVSLVGEPGMGKSRLVFELRRSLEQHPISPLAPFPAGGGIVAWYSAPCDGLVGQSLNPLRFVLREVFEHDPSATEALQWQRFDGLLDARIALLRQDGQAGAELARELDRTRSLLAALLDLRREGTLYERLDPKLRFENTLLALRALVLAECRRRPLVLHLDDAHWLDEDSATFLRELTRDADAPFLVLLSGRTREDAAPFAALDAAVPHATLDLGALGEQGMRTMAAQLLGGPIDDALAAFLAAKTSANPFFVEQLLLDLRERRALERGEGGVWRPVATALEAVPDLINAVLIARLDRLTGHVKAVVQTASVLGNEFEVRVLSLMLRESLELSQVVRQAESDAIWVALGEIRYIFRHGLLRDAAYDMQLRSRLRALHLLAGEALEQLYADDLDAHAADLVYHYGRAEDPPRERRFARLAGEYTAAQFANADAVEHLSRALALTPEGELAERIALLLLREQVYDRQGARDSQLADLDSLGALADALDDGRLRVELALRRARYADTTGTYPSMIAASQEAIRLADLVGGEGKAAGYLQWARALWYQSEYVAARERAEEALRLARLEGQRRLEADCWRSLGNVALELGEYDAARAAYLQGLALHRELGDRQGESYTLNNLGIVAFYQGDYAMARDDYEASRQIKQETGDRYGQSLALINLGEVATMQRNYEAAHAYSTQSLRLCREIGYQLGQSISLLNLGMVSAALGDYAAADRIYQEALRLSEEIGHPQQERDVLAHRALLAHQMGDQRTALEHAGLAMAKALEGGDRNSQALALTFIGHALVGRDLLEEADEAYGEALGLRAALGQESGTAEILAGRLRVALARGDVAGALALAELILPQLQGLEGAFEPARVFLSCYQALAAAGDARAPQVLADGRALLEQQAATLDDAARARFLQQVAAHRELLALAGG